MKNKKLFWKEVKKMRGGMDDVHGIKKSDEVLVHRSEEVNEVQMKHFEFLMSVCGRKSKGDEYVSTSWCGAERGRWSS